MTGPRKVDSAVFLTRMKGTGELRATDPERVGPYRVLGRLGTGGMGQVYLARSPGGRAVAIKVIKPELAEKRGFRARFAREVAAARGVSGMFTAAVVDADPGAELPWMATAYVEGPSLADEVEQHGPMAPDEVMSLAAGLAEGLQAIHRAGLVHRDLKPSNVLLAADGPRVIDFGVSWAREEGRLTDAGMTVGSPGFLSPEQARGQVVDPASDVFALGAVLAYAATGEGPFGDGPDQALMYRVVHEQPDLSRVPGELRWLIESCLAKKPGYRPTMEQLLSRLAAVMAGIATPDPGTGAHAAQEPASGPRSWIPATGARVPRAPMTGNGLSAAYYAKPDTPGGAYTSLDKAPLASSAPEDEPARDRRARRMWLAVAGVAAACVALTVGAVMTLASPGGQDPAPVTPPAFVVPTGTAPGTGSAAKPSIGPGNVAPSPRSATKPAASASSSATAPSKAPSSGPASSRSAVPPAHPTTAPPSPGPASTPPTTPAPSASPTGHCFLIFCS